MAKLIREENDAKSNTNAKHLLLSGQPNINTYEHLETPLQTKFLTMQMENVEMLKTGLQIDDLKAFHQQYMSRVKQLIDINKRIEKEVIDWPAEPEKEIKAKDDNPLQCEERSSSQQSSSESEKIAEKKIEAGYKIDAAEMEEGIMKKLEE
jgi:hypothetical protein